MPSDEGVAHGDVISLRYVFEGWWHPNTRSGQVHDHPEKPGRGWSSASHSLCERVYTLRKVTPHAV